MDELEAKATALLKGWETGDYATVARDFDADFAEFDPPQRTVKGLDGLIAKQELFRKVHSNIRVHVMRQVGNERSVCTHFLLLADVVTPTGVQTVQQAGMAWAGFQNGRIKSHRVYRDTIGYLMQRGYRWDLGAMPQRPRRRKGANA